MKFVSLLPVLLVAAVLIVWPWLKQDRPSPAPARFDATHATYDSLVDVAGQVDRSCRGGDLALLESQVTERCLINVRLRLKAAGKAWSGDALKHQHIVGELNADSLLVGGANSSRAALIYRHRRHDRAGGEFLLAVTFVWDGRRFRLDGTDFQRSKAQAAEAVVGTGSESTPTEASGGGPAQARSAVQVEAEAYLRDLLGDSQPQPR